MVGSSGRRRRRRRNVASPAMMQRKAKPPMTPPITPPIGISFVGISGVWVPLVGIVVEGVGTGLVNARVLGELAEED